MLIEIMVLAERIEFILDMLFEKEKGGATNELIEEIEKLELRIETLERQIID